MAELEPFDWDKELAKPDDQVDIPDDQNENEFDWDKELADTSEVSIPFSDNVLPPKSGIEPFDWDKELAESDNEEGMSKADALIFASKLGVTDTYRGVKQLIGTSSLTGILSQGSKYPLPTGTIPQDPEYEKEQQRKLNKLMQHPEYGGQVMMAYFGGAIADPASWLLPFAKAGTLAKMTWNMAKASGLAGFFGYVDEDQESLVFQGKTSRGEQAITGAVFGTALAPVVYGASKVAGKVASTINPGGVPDNAPQLLDAANNMLGPDIFARVNGRKLVQPVSGSTKNLQHIWQKYAGHPIHGVVTSNPGSSLTGMFTGNWAMDELKKHDPEATTSQVMMAGLSGFLSGFIGARYIGKIPLEGPVMGAYGDTVQEVASRMFINNYGLGDEYITLKRTALSETNHVAGQFVEILKRFKTMDTDEKKLMYNFMNGDLQAGVGLKPGDLTLANKTLHDLSEESRALLTETAQKMVDYGLLDPRVFKTNMNTYLHRSYAGNKDSQTVFRASRNVKLMGDELRMRGTGKELNKNDPDYQVQLQRHLDDGFEVLEDTPDAVKIRRDYTKDERINMGEIEDASYAMAETGRLMANDIGVFKFYNDVAERFAKNKVEMRAEFGGKIMSTEELNAAGWVQMPKGKLAEGESGVNTYGNLAGKWIPKNIERDIRAINLTKRVKNYPVVKQLRGLVGLWKESKTAWNPTVHMNNIMANFVLHDLADSDPKHLFSAAKGVKDILSKADMAESKIINQAQTDGVFDADFASQELFAYVNAVTDAKLSREAIHMNPLESGYSVVKGLASTTYAKTIGNMTKLYSMEDKFFRLSIYMDRLEKGFSRVNAAKEARKWFIDYDIQAPAIQILRETAVPFISYPYRVIPLLAESATLRPWKYFKWAGLGYALNNMGERGSGTEEAATERASLPKRQQGHAFNFGGPLNVRLPFNIKSTDGTQQAAYMDMTRFIPGGDVMEVSDATGILPAPFSPGFGLLGDTYNTFIAGYDSFTDRPIPGLGKGGAEDAWTKIKYMGKKLDPGGAFHKASTISKAVKGKYGELEQNLPLWAAIAKSFGIKVNVQDPKHRRGKKMMELNNMAQAYTDEMKQNYKRLQHGEYTRKEFNAEAKRIQEKMQMLVNGKVNKITIAEEYDENNRVGSSIEEILMLNRKR